MEGFFLGLADRSLTSSGAWIRCGQLLGHYDGAAVDDLGGVRHPSADQNRNATCDGVDRHSRIMLFMVESS
jgi:hypothetical protein